MQVLSWVTLADYVQRDAGAGGTHAVRSIQEAILEAVALEQGLGG